MFFSFLLSHSQSPRLGRVTTQVLKTYSMACIVSGRMNTVSLVVVPAHIPKILHRGGKAGGGGGLRLRAGFIQDRSWACTARRSWGGRALAGKGFIAIYWIVIDPNSRPSPRVMSVILRIWRAPACRYPRSSAFPACVSEIASLSI